MVFIKLFTMKDSWVSGKKESSRYSAHSNCIGVTSRPPFLLDVSVDGYEAPVHSHNRDVDNSVLTDQCSSPNTRTFMRNSVSGLPFYILIISRCSFKSFRHTETHTVLKYLCCGFRVRHFPFNYANLNSFNFWKQGVFWEKSPSFLFHVWSSFINVQCIDYFLNIGVIHSVRILS